MRVLLVEDEVDLGSAIKNVLVSEKYIVDWVTDGQQALNYLDNQWTEYTVAIFDWMLPTLSGLDLCKKVRAQKQTLPILMLTALGEPENRVTGLDAGADDYLIKPFVMDELLARLRALQRRSPLLHPPELNIGIFSLDEGSSTFIIKRTDSLTTIPLTIKEFQILKYLMKNQDRIVSGSKIRQQLWDLQEEPMSNVVAAHIRLLRRKFATYECQCPIETIPGQGYRFIESR